MFKNRGIILVPAVLLLCLTQGLLAAQFAVISESFNVSPGGTLTVEVVAADKNIRREENGVTVNVKGLAEEYRQWLEMTQVADGVSIKFDPESKFRN